MKTKNLLTKVQSRSEIYIYGAGKMGQQVLSLLRNLPEKKEPSAFIASTGVGTLVDGIPVLTASDAPLRGDYLVLVASGRGNHAAIAAVLAETADMGRVIFLSPQDLDVLKRSALGAMLHRLGIDPTLLRSLTNDIFASITTFDSETYSGSIRRKMFEISLAESAQFVIDHMPEAKSFSDCWAYREWVLAKAPMNGLHMEFGVADGSTLDFFAKERPHVQFHGFDSFVGLPEFWKDGFDQGRFAQARLPEVPGNVELIKGWFSDTVTPFMARPRIAGEDIAFAHIDCDLYSSTQDILNGCGERLSVGSILAFDEYFNYPGWQAHEHKAFVEFASETGVGFRYIAYVENGNQVAVEITSIAKTSA